MFQILRPINTSLSRMKMMVPDREAGPEVEVGEMETEMETLPAPGRGLEGSLVDPVVTTKANGPLTQACLAGMVPIVLTGEETRKWI